MDDVRDMGRGMDQARKKSHGASDAVERQEVIKRDVAPEPFALFEEFNNGATHREERQKKIGHRNLRRTSRNAKAPPNSSVHGVL
jgi:hypothetical protein